MTAKLTPGDKRKLQITGALCVDGGTGSIPFISQRDFSTAKPEKVYAIVLRVSGAPDWKEKKRFASTDCFGEPVVLVLEDPEAQWHQVYGKDRGRKFPLAVMAYGTVIQREGGGKEFYVRIVTTVKGRYLAGDTAGFVDLKPQYDFEGHARMLDVRKRYPSIFYEEDTIL